MTKRIILLSLFACTPIMLFAQNNGIRFEQNLTWAQVKAKAKAEHKNIFLDCYATWCAPCKKMDVEVYPKDSVGQMMNDRFISFKVQMDSTKNDNKVIKTWYPDAKSIAQTYQVTALPTFLFFDADGKAIGKNIGAKTTQEFIKIVSGVIKDADWYHEQYISYRNGRLDPKLVPKLAKMAVKMGNKAEGQTVAKDYIDNYLNKVPVDTFLKADNINLIGTGAFYELVTPQDRIFDIVFNHDKQFDAVQGKGRAALFRKVYLDRVEVQSLKSIAEKNNQDIDWKTLAGKLKEKYGERITTEFLLQSKLDWYNYNFNKYKKWANEYIHAFADVVESEDINTYDDIRLGLFVHNTIEALIITHCDDPLILNKAINWEGLVMQTWAYDVIDVYAGLLYKVGKVKQAIKWQEMLVEILEYREMKKPNNAGLAKSKRYLKQLEVLNAMKKGTKANEIWGGNN